MVEEGGLCCDHRFDSICDELTTEDVMGWKEAFLG